MNNGILGKSVLGFCEFLWPKVWDSRLLAALVNIRWTGPPTLFPCFRRRYPSKLLDLRHFSSISVGGTPRNSRTSDTFSAFPSEVPLESPGPPTLFPYFRRRYPSKVLDLRHFSRISVGGTPRNSWTSDTFPVFLSEVPLESPGPPTLSRHFCRRWAQSKPCESFGSSSRGLF